MWCLFGIWHLVFDAFIHGAQTRANRVTTLIPASGGRRTPPRPIVPVALAVIAGIAVGLVLPVPGWLAWMAALGAVGAAWWPAPRRGGRGRGLRTLLALGALGLAVVRLHQTRPPSHIAHIAAGTPRTVVVRGLIVEDPVAFWDAWGQPKTTVVVEVSGRRTETAWSPSTGRLRVTIVGHRDEPLRYGDDVALEGTLEPPRRRAGDAFDWRAYLARHDIYATLRVPAYQPVLVLRRDQGHWLWRQAFRARAWAHRLLCRLLDGSSSAMLLAMLLGERAALERAWVDAFIRTGTVHILSVSGLHVGLLAALVLGLLRLCRAPAWLADAAAVAWLVFYAVLTGGGVPIVRSTVMIGAWLIGRRLERAVDLVQSLALAAVIVLVWQPLQLTDPGFQLSFGSVLAIAVIVPVLERCWPVEERSVIEQRAWPARVARWWRMSLRVSLGCWLGITPLVIWHYHLCSLVTILANLWVVPLLGVVLGLGMICVAVGGWGGWLATAVSVPTQWAVHLLLRGVAVLADVPGGWWPMTISWWMLVAAYLGLAWWLWRAQRNTL